MGKEKFELKVWDKIYILWTTYSDFYSTVYKWEVLRIEEREIDYEDEYWELGTYYKTVYLIECWCKKKCKFYIDEDFEFYSSFNYFDEEFTDEVRRWHRNSEIFTDLDKAIKKLKEWIKTHYEAKIRIAEIDIKNAKDRLDKLDDDINSIYNNLKD